MSDAGLAAEPPAKQHRAEGGSVVPPAHPVLNPDPRVCSLWLPAKRRYCRAEVHKGSHYCGAHLRLDSAFADVPGERRVPCPINPNHDVREKDVQRHVLICQDRQLVAADSPYYSAGCNGGRSASAVDDATLSGGAAGSAELWRMDKRQSGTAHYRNLRSEELERLIT
jgi:hypothetical protein